MFRVRGIRQEPKLRPPEVRAATLLLCFCGGFVSLVVGTRVFDCDVSFYCHPLIKAVVTGVVPFPPPFLSSISIAQRDQYSHCSSISIVFCCLLPLFTLLATGGRVGKSPPLKNMHHPRFHFYTGDHYDQDLRKRPKPR